jgi:HJR/Mrr/RecB family endonuclease
MFAASAWRVWMYQREISHEGLHKRHSVKGEYPETVNLLAEIQIHAWNEQWEREQAVQKERRDKLMGAIRMTGPGRCDMDVDIVKDLVGDRTRDFQQAIDALGSLLVDAVEKDHSIDWALLADNLINKSNWALAGTANPVGEFTSRWKEAYLACEANAVKEYCRLVLCHSKYPDSFPHDAAVDYIADSRTLVVDYSLPDTRALPRVKELRFLASRGTIEEVNVSDAWLDRIYDSVLYQVALRSLYELFQADAARAIDSIVFNGWVNSIDKATGKEINGCILSIHTTKVKFMDLNLARVDPKTCFKKLKGVSAAKLVALQPVRPILQLNRRDRRFIHAHDVADGLDSSSNLAAMDWEDFEHLVRELFEKEFSTDGTEVKITQASRDGGVDAIVFDPDPIHGGKIVIQAKRYTNTVSVSAVRDLFGTVHNEGANKGILVTTADYGPDAYEFAKGKPLTLISGGELLYLLAKHGHKARIDLKEARMVATMEQERFPRLRNA